MRKEDVAVALILSELFFACSPEPDRQISTPTVTVEPVATATTVTAFPTVRPVETPRRIDASPTLSFLAEHDINLKVLIDRAEADQRVRLDNVFISHILRFPWEGKQAYLATLSTLDKGGKSQISAVVLSADCIFEAMEAENALGNPVLGGAWKPTKRVDNLAVKVSAPSSVVNAIPILSVEEITQGGKTRSCVEVTAIQRLKDFISRVNWKGLPENTGEFISWFAREFLDGFRRGFG